MVKTVKVTTDNRLYVLELPQWDFENQELAVDADCVEKVRTQIMQNIFKDSVVMLVDESGAANGKPVNELASILYGQPQHGQPIFGDIIFGLLRGPHILPPDNADQLALFLKRYFPFLKYDGEGSGKVG